MKSDEKLEALQNAFEEGRFEECLRLINELPPDVRAKPNVLARIGDCRYETNCFTEAVNAYTTAIETTGSESLRNFLRYNRGLALRELDEWSLAKRDFETVHRHYLDREFFIGEAATKLKQFTDGLRFLNEWIEIRGETASSDKREDALYWRATCLNQLGRHADALEVFRLLYHSGCDNCRILNGLITEMVWLDDRAGLRELYSELANKRLGRDSDVLNRLVEVIGESDGDN